LLERLYPPRHSSSLAVGGPYAHRVAHLARQYELIQPMIDYLRARVPSVVAAWDDHDFGENDSGGDLPYKHESKALFLQAWRPSVDANESPPEPAPGAGLNEERYNDGIYTAYEYPVGDGDVMLQLLLLDTRFNRSPLKGDPMKGQAVPNHDEVSEL
jgi:alkaline phosphatase D